VQRAAGYPAGGGERAGVPGGVAKLFTWGGGGQFEVFFFENFFPPREQLCNRYYSNKHTPFTSVW
jgi:hypothetical protein